MLFGFELLGLGISLDSVASPIDFSDFSFFSLSFLHETNACRPYGIIGELLQIPILSNTSTFQSPDPPVSYQFTLGLFVGPLFASCLAYIVIIVGVKIASLTELQPKMEEIIPQKVFCFKSIDLPEIVLAPTRMCELPDFKRSDLWQNVMEGHEEVADETLTGFSPYLAVGSDLEMFSPVVIPALKLPIKAKRSFFSS
jgi:hypothetical protein